MAEQYENIPPIYTHCDEYWDGNPQGAHAQIDQINIGNSGDKFKGFVKLDSGKQIPSSWNDVGIVSNGPAGHNIVQAVRIFK